MQTKTGSLTKLARKFLQTDTDALDVLRMHDFKDDEAMHDDELHDRLCAEFSAQVDRAREELAKTYGKPFQTGNADHSLIPLNGVVRYAAWRVGKQRLFVAAAREERECPFLVVLGVTAGGGEPRSETPAPGPKKEARHRRPKPPARKPVQRRPPPLPGRTEHPCERCLYVALKPGETPERQQDAVYDRWGPLYRKWRRKTGKMVGGLYGPSFLLTLPDAESFGDFTVSRYPGSVGETAAEMPPFVEAGLALLRELAQLTGRCCARIENRTVFACDDGRRIPLKQCVYRELRTRADYALKARARTNPAAQSHQRA